MKYLLAILICFLFGCSTKYNYKYDTKIDGTFVGNNSNNILTFKNNDYVLLSTSNFTDTISYGKWYSENNFITLKSDLSMLKNIFNIKIDESLSTNRDSIYFSIENDLNGLYDYEDNYYPYLYFSVNRYFSDGSYNESKPFINKISLANKSIIKFNITIVPNLFVYPEVVSGQAFKTYLYEIKTKGNNNFKIKILDFKDKCFSYKAFQSEYIKIISNDTLMWDNEYYIKQLTK